MTTALQTLNRDTGEVQVSEVFDFEHYLTSIGESGLTRQQKLAAVYDAACHALIGPNDVQVEGGRSFKKKSAWRKLGRHFNISTSVLTITKEWLEDGVTPDDSGTFVAVVTVRATAPWGQYTDAVGACGTDEESGRRKITIADAIATAETRATNRAISNLIAMGEVSAEEMSKGQDSPARQKPAGERVMPFGKHKGQKLGDVPVDDLSSTIAWCKEKDAKKFVDLIAACEEVVRQKNNGSLDEPPEALQEEEDDLPW